MSFFKTKAIILKIDKLKEKEFLYTIFSDDYGKIKVIKKFSSKEKALDLGYLINSEIETSKNGNIHKIKNIKILKEFNSQNKKFSEINSYLELINTLLINTPEGSKIYGIYDIFELLLKNQEINETKITLAKLKIKDICGDLGVNHKDETINKILKFINLNNFSKILLLKGIEDRLLLDLKNI